MPLVINRPIEPVFEGVAGYCGAPQRANNGATALGARRYESLQWMWSLNIYSDVTWASLGNIGRVKVSYADSTILSSDL